MKYIIDSYAWIEYLDGTSAGSKVREILMQDNEIYTFVLTLTEIISRAKRKGKDTNIVYNAIAINSRIIQASSEIAKEAGLLHAEMRKKIKDFGLIDSLLLMLARKLNAKIITGDAHFKKIKEAVFIK